MIETPHSLASLGCNSRFFQAIRRTSPVQLLYLQNAYKKPNGPLEIGHRHPGMDFGEIQWQQVGASKLCLTSTQLHKPNDQSVLYNLLRQPC